MQHRKCRGTDYDQHRFVIVPYICNVKDVVEGEELIVRHVARAKTKKVENRTWRDVAKREEAELKQKQKQKLRSHDRSRGSVRDLCLTAIAINAVAAAFGTVLTVPGE